MKPPRYRSPTVCYDGEIGLDEFTDEDIRQEYAHRFDAPGGFVDEEEHPVLVSALRLRQIMELMRVGRNSEAMRAADDLIRDTLGTAI